MEMNNKPYWLEEVSPEAATRREMFAIFGRAVYFCQCFERQLAIMAATMFNKEFGPADLEKRDSFFEANFRKTCGQIIYELKKTIRMGDRLSGRILEALKHRNLLIHNYFWNKVDQMRTMEGQKEIIEELRHIGDMIHSLDEELTALSLQWCEKAGVSKETIEAEMEKYGGSEPV